MQEPRTVVRHTATEQEPLGTSGELGEEIGKPFHLHELVAVVRGDGSVVKMRVYGVKGRNTLMLRRVPGMLPTKIGIPG